MKLFKKRRILSMMLAVLLLTMTANLAEETEKTAIVISDINAMGISAIPDGRLLIAGYRGKWMQSTPVIIICDRNGSILWEMRGESVEGERGMFSDAAYVDEHTLLAIESEPDYHFSVKRIFNGEIVGGTIQMENAYDLYIVEEGFLVNSKEVEGEDQIEIRKFDMTGRQVWELVLQEPLIVKGILTGDHANVAYGLSQDQDDDMYTPWYSFLFAFDDNGKILWRAEAERCTSFQKAAWAKDGNVALLGFEGEVWDGAAEEKRLSFFAQYGAQGLISRKDYAGYTAQINGETVEAYSTKIAMLPVEEGYLIAETVDRFNGLHMLLVSEDGTIIKSWQESTAGVNVFQEAELFCMEGRYYFVGGGYYFTGGDDTSGALVIKELNYPQ